MSEKLESITEHGITIQVDKEHLTPNKTKTFYNHKMIMNREMVLCALGAFLESRKQQNINGAAECLDAFTSTGLAGMLWKRTFCKAVAVTLNDLSEQTVEHAAENCRQNGFNVLRIDKPSSNAPKVDEASTSTLELRNDDACVVLHQKAFDFVHLDPFGCCVQFLDAAFHHIRTGGVMCITSTDIGSLYGTCTQVTRRNYGAHSNRTEYVKELAVRIIIAAIVRSAAKCCKGVRVLASVAVEHFVLVVVQVVRSTVAAERCLSMVGTLLHCMFCEERSFLAPNTNHSPVPDVNPYLGLSCKCSNAKKGQTGVVLGPLWKGNIFNSSFVSKMVDVPNKLNMKMRCQPLLCELQAEASGTMVKISADQLIARDSAAESETTETATSEQFKNGTSKRLLPQGGVPDMTSLSKRAKIDVNPDNDSCPPFYFHTHKHAICANLPKVKDVVEMLRKKGFHATKTHFDPQAIRTNANLHEFKETLNNVSNKIQTSHVLCQIINS